MGKAQESPPHRNIIVLGASAGGVQALCEVISNLPPNLPAAVFVVLHVAPHGRSAMPSILARAGCLPASHPQDGEPIVPGRIYIAPPDRHLVIEDSTVCLSRDATENGHRPAIDVLFRSAAREHGRRVIAVVLTGNLDDGTAGLGLVKRLGGVAVVQDPREADYPSMPQSAIANVPVDYVAPLADIGSLLTDLVHEPLPEPAPEPTPEEREELPGMTEQEEHDGSIKGSLPGSPAPSAAAASSKGPAATCPCTSAAARATPIPPRAFWPSRPTASRPPSGPAMRALQENAALARRMEKRARAHGGDTAGERYHRRAEDAEKHAALLRTLLQQGGADLE